MERLPVLSEGFGPRPLIWGTYSQKAGKMERFDSIRCIAGLVASVHEADSFPDSTSTNTLPAREN